MSRLINIILLCFPAFLYAQETEAWFLKCDSSSGNCGYINQYGKFLIPPGKYEHCYTHPFLQVAFVKMNDKVWGINKKEDRLFELFCANDSPDTPSNGLFRIIKNQKIGYANMQGEIIIPPIYDAAMPFINEMAFVNLGCNADPDKPETFWKGGKWGAINKEGKVMVPIQYSNMNFLSNTNQEVKTPETTQ